MMIPRLLVFVLLALPIFASAQEAAGPASRSSLRELPVACVALAARADIDENAERIIAALEREAAAGTRLAVFSECALTTYDGDIIRRLRPEQIDAALERVRAACDRLNIYAVVGSAYYDGDRRYNGAFVFDPDGRLIMRYGKMHTVKRGLFVDGDRLAIFRIDDVPATLMICHDERYPEIFRIPVLAGAKVGIYISCESKKPAQKLDNYRSQVMARAVENQISVVHCNAGDGGVDGGSHGHSRIIDPKGRILAEAGSGADEVIRAVIRPEDSENAYARRGAETPSLHRFWQEGLRILREQNPEFFQP